MDEGFTIVTYPLPLLKELNIGYIISVKPEGQDSLFAEVKNRVLKGQCEEFEVLGEDRIP